MALFDLILPLILIGLAIAILASKDLFRAVILFITFGLLTTLCWIRLEAPDVALAEAAIGAGLMGVFFLETIGYASRRAKQKQAPSKDGIS